MTNCVRDEKSWKALKLEEKIDALHEDVVKLFGIVEEFSHKNHVFVDAINLVHGRLDKFEKTLRNNPTHSGEPELTE